MPSEVEIREGLAIGTIVAVDKAELYRLMDELKELRHIKEKYERLRSMAVPRLEGWDG